MPRRGGVGWRGGLTLLRDDEGFSPCLIILDLMMPGMNGWDFLQLRGHHAKLSRIPIAVASAFPFAEKEILPGISDHCLCGDRQALESQAHQRV